MIPCSRWRLHQLQIIPSEVQLMLQDIPAVMPSQVEVGMLRQIHQSGFVCGGINEHFEDALSGHDIGHTHFECAWVPL